jgi:hypothetical protein
MFDFGGVFSATRMRYRDQVSREERCGIQNGYRIVQLTICVSHEKTPLRLVSNKAQILGGITLALRCLVEISSLEGDENTAQSLYSRAGGIHSNRC